MAPGGMQPLEEVLGPSAGRYFGLGYRAVRYGIRSHAKLGGGRSEIRAETHAAYPRTWSLDSGGVPRLPHLSSIDAIVLPLFVFEATRGNEDLRRLSTLRVQEIELRAAGQPWLKLDAVPVSLSVGVASGSEILTSTVGNIRSRIVLAGQARPTEQVYTNARRHDLTVYSGMFQAGECRSFVAARDVMSGVLRGAHEFSVAHSTEHASPGIEANIWPSPTIVDYLVTMGQLTQAMIYARDGIDRSTTGALWMRTMEITIDGPSPQAPVAFETTTRLVRDRVLDRNGRRLHDLVVESSATTGVQARASLAYEEATAR